MAYGKLNGMQESNVCAVLRYLIASSVFDEFVHAQNGWTPLHMAANKGHVEIAQLMMEKSANIEATDKVQLVANVYWSTIYGCLEYEVLNIH